MRSKFANVMYGELSENLNSCLLLGDIGVNAHRNSMRDFPDRVFNVGILEQSMVGMAGGLAVEGLTPTIHTIAPFVVERAYEQLKIDLGYQELSANVVTVGASLDYAALGATHHCPSDVSLILNIPNSKVFVPGHENEFEVLFKLASRLNGLNYFRLSESQNSLGHLPQFLGQAIPIRKGGDLTIIAIGPTLDLVMNAVLNEDVTVLYYSCLFPFDSKTLADHVESKKVLVVEPFFTATTASLIWKIAKELGLAVEYFGIPRKFHRSYGSRQDHYNYFGFTEIELRRRVLDFAIQ